MSRSAALFLTCALILGAALPAAAQQTLGFDDLACFAPTPIANGYAGLSWSNFGCFDPSILTSPGGGGGVPGTISPPNIAFNLDGNPASFGAATPFTLNRAYLTSVWHDDLDLTVTGLLGGSTIFTKSLVLSATAPTLVQFGWAGVDEVLFVSSGGTLHPGYEPNDGTQFAMDDLVINGPLTSAPEPVSLLLVGSGLAGLGVIGRRRRRQA